MKKKVYTNFWKKIGQTDPYFGVLTHPEYRTDQLDEKAKEKFYASGKTHIDNVFQLFKRVWPNYQPTRGKALDFGCGTGRLTLALSSYFEEVTGVDVSAAMLEHAKKNQRAKNITNVTFQEIPDRVPFLKDNYDYIHSSIVFQHIPPENGLLILDHLLQHLKADGHAFLQLTYNNLSSPDSRKKQYYNFTYPLLKKWLGKKIDYAFPMFDYDLNQVFALLQKHNIRRMHQRFGQSGNHQFVGIYAKKHPPKT